MPWTSPPSIQEADPSSRPQPPLPGLGALLQRPRLGQSRRVGPWVRARRGALSVSKTKPVCGGRAALQGQPRGPGGDVGGVAGFPEPACASCPGSCVPSSLPEPENKVSLSQRPPSPSPKRPVRPPWNREAGRRSHPARPVDISRALGLWPRARPAGNGVLLSLSSPARPIPQEVGTGTGRSWEPASQRGREPERT